MRSLVLFLLLSVVTSSCFIGGDGFGTRFCKKNEDCPSAVAGYICASTATWPQRGCAADEDGCLCEVRFPPEPGGISIDGGMPMVPDAGPPPDYCTEIKPLIDRICLGTCHSSQMVYPGSPTDFRLDYWEPRPEHRLPDGGMGLPGVKAKVDRLKARIYDEKTMPPGLNVWPIQPTDAERALFNKWITKFGAPLGDGGCEVGDAGSMMPGDGGMTTMDAGVDAGAPVSFSTQIVPIFTQRCGPCHTTNTSGTLSLTAANAYNALVNTDVSAACVGGPRKRVLANQPNQSQLWLKASDDATKCGNFMPRNQTPLKTMAPAQFDLIERWIRQGAPNN